jgi:DNA-binding NtrC family response regulator
MLRILLVDTDRTNRNSLRELLQAAGAECVDGTEATITHVSKDSFDAVMVVNPTETRSANVPVFHCYTFNPGASVIAQAIARGASEALVMPFSAQHLMFKFQQLGLNCAKLAA